MGFDGNIDTEKKRLDFNSFMILLSNSNVKVMRSKEDGKFYFYGENGEPEYIREKELPYVREAHMCMYYINVFCANQPNEDFTKIQSKAAVCAMYTNEALNNNSPDVVIFHEPPAKGELHNEYAKEAEACALKQYSNTVDVIIGSDDWIIQRNSPGIIICRVCTGWIIVEDDLGKLAIPAKWAQDNQGGDTYGSNKRFHIK